MLRKNIAPVIAVVLSGILFIIIGSCFSAFLYKSEIIKVQDPRVFAQGNIVITDKKGKSVNKLELSELKLGLKPATGEEDAETGIPSTISDKSGSEGLFCKFCVKNDNDCTIIIKNILVKNKTKKVVDVDRENIVVAIKEIDKSTKTLLNDVVELGSVSKSENKKEFTFYVWLSGKASQELKATTISFDIYFE